MLTTPAAITRGQKAFPTECVDFFAEVVQLFGVPKSVGQIYGLLYASSVPLSFSDIVEELKISKGSASQGLQLLRSLGAINVAETIGDESKTPSQITHRVSRCVTYEPELSLRKLVSGILHERVGPFALIGAERLVRLRKLAEMNGEHGEFYLDRVRQLEIWRRRLKALLPVLTGLLGTKSRK